MSVSVGSGLSRLKKLGRRLLAKQRPKGNVKAQPIPEGVAAERRSGRRVPLPIDVRIKRPDDLDPRDARLRDVNVTGLAIEPADGVKLDDRISVGFNGYPNVCPPFALVGSVKRILLAIDDGEPAAMGLQIDRERSSAEALLNYRRLVRHYLHHRPLLDDMAKGFFEGKCEECDWVGRAGRRKPKCPRCGERVIPLEKASNLR